MNTKLLMFALMGVALAATGLSAAGILLSPGKYMATVGPTLTENQADAIEKQLGQIQEIQSVDVKPKELTLHFTVKNNAQVDVGRIFEAAKTAVPGLAVSDPFFVEPAKSSLGLY